MAEPTIERRLERRFILVTSDPVFEQEVCALIPEGWSVAVTVDLERVGDWNDILMHRFLVLDADDSSVDGVAMVEQIRTEFMLQIAIFCFGGEADLRDALRLARADRFYDRNRLATTLPDFFGQYAW